MSKVCFSRPLDESIQSYILRKLIVNGESDFSTVLDGSGQWLVDFQLNTHQLSYFTNEDEQHLYTLVRDHYCGMTKAHPRESPLHIKELVASIFYGQHNFTHYDDLDREASFLRKKFKAKFCIECLKDSLSQYGYGYFKSSWYYDIICGVHHAPLLIMNTSNSIESNNAFRQIIRGELPPNHAVAEAKHKEMNLYSDDIFHSYTTPCLLELATAKLRFFVADYFRADQSLFDAILNSIMTRLEKRLLYSTGEPKKAKFRDVAEGFRRLQEKEYAPVIAFLNDSVEITQGMMGIKSFGSMRFPALTPTDRDCKKCTVSNKHCALSPVIGIFLNPQRVDLSEGNYCDRVNAAYRRSDYRRVEFKVRNRTDFLEADRFTF
ncbi:hypothetical protein ACVBIO_13400 [Shewanella sp. 0m-8]